MKQSDLNRAVARLTGESVRLVRQRGFTLVNVDGPERCRESACAAQLPPQASARRPRVGLPPSPAA